MAVVDNDYELLYMIQNDQDSYALELLSQKYKAFIWKVIKTYRVPNYDEEDYYQEGIITLYKAATTFNEWYNKTFTRYFEMLLKRRFWNLLKSNNRYVICEDLDQTVMSPNLTADEEYLLDEQHDELQDKLTQLSETEMEIFKLYFEDGVKIDVLTEKYNLSRKKMYNIIFKIKKILRH